MCNSHFSARDSPPVGYQHVSAVILGHLEAESAHERGSIGDERAVLTDTLEIDEAHPEQAEFGRVPDLVAEFTVSFDLTDVEVEFSAWASGQGETGGSSTDLPPEVLLHKANLRASVPH